MTLPLWQKGKKNARASWHAAAQGVTRSPTRLSDWAVMNITMETILAQTGYGPGVTHLL